MQGHPGLLPRPRAAHGWGRCACGLACRSGRSGCVPSRAHIPLERLAGSSLWGMADSTGARPHGPCHGPLQNKTRPQGAAARVARGRGAAAAAPQPGGRCGHDGGGSTLGARSGRMGRVCGGPAAGASGASLEGAAARVSHSEVLVGGERAFCLWDKPEAGPAFEDDLSSRGDDAVLPRCSVFFFNDLQQAGSSFCRPLAASLCSPSMCLSPAAPIY